MGRLGSGPRLVGQIGSVVRVSVSFQQKYPPGSVLRCPTAAENGVMTKGVVSGEWGGLAPLCLRRITSSPSQTLRPVTIRRRLSPGEVITIQAFLSTCMRPELCGCLKFQSSLSQQSQQIRLYWIRVNEQIYRIRILHTMYTRLHTATATESPATGTMCCLQQLHRASH